MKIITLLVLGILFIVIGLVNITGNISTIHSYHRRRVRQEDTKKYGEIIGSGMIIIGILLILNGTLQIILKQENLDYITAIGLIVGLLFFIYAQIKYNKGIF